MRKLLGAKTINTVNGLRRGTLHAERNGNGRIIGVTLSIEGIGAVSFAHVHGAKDYVKPTNAAERLEALRGLACPMSAVRVRRNENAAYGHGEPEYVAGDGI